MLCNVNRSVLLSCLLGVLEIEATPVLSKPRSIEVSKSAPLNAGIPLDSFVSFSFELSSWPDFAGMMNNGSYKSSVVLILHLQATCRTQMLSAATS